MSDIGYPEPIPLFTAGWSGSEASHDRAVREAEDGTKEHRENVTLSFLDAMGSHGATWRELGDAKGWHHGQSSGVLSTLHKAGKIARLTEKRDRCSVYVLPEYVNERDTSVHGHHPRQAATEAQIRDAFEAGWHARNMYDPIITDPSYCLNADWEHFQRGRG